MTKSKDIRKKLESQYRSLEEHLQKIANEQAKETIDQGLIGHWESTVANCRQIIDRLERRLNR